MAHDEVPGPGYLAGTLQAIDTLVAGYVAQARFDVCQNIAKTNYVAL